MRRLLHLFVFCCATAAVHASDSDPLNRPLLTQDDFTYIGSFQMPTSANGWSTAFSTGGLTLRYLNGKLQFLTTSHVYSGGLVYETNFPGLSKTAPYPQAQVVKEWGDVYSGHKYVANDGGTSDLSSGVLTYGLYYDQNLKRLYWNYGHWYNATNPDNPSVGYSVLNDATGVAAGIGAWSLVDRPEKFARGGTTRIPQWFADRFTGGKSLAVGFGGYFSICSTGSFGPALAAINDPDISASPDRSALANVPLAGYPYGAADRGHRDTDYHSEYDNGAWNPANGIGYWTWSDIIYGSSVWLDLSGKQGVLVIAKVGQGRVWYETSDRHAERGSYEWLLYDPKDLADVAGGRKQQWEIQPRARWNDAVLPISNDANGYSGDGLNQVGGAAFDETTNRLYLLVNGAWKSGVEWYPQVYVYQLNATPRTTPVLTWPSPAAINYGTPLSVTQLNATASVPGSFVYTPPAGTVLNVGTQTLSVTFTPTDTATYSAATASVNINVVSVSTYDLTVVNGSGSGNYPAGTVVNIAANPPPDGQVFARWTAGAAANVADFTAASTSLTMPAAATTITATYQVRAPGQPPAPGTLTIAKLSGKASFGLTGEDHLALQASVPLPNAWKPGGVVVNINAAGAAATFTLNAKGMRRSNNGTLKVNVSKATLVLTASLKGGTWSTAWAAFGAVSGNAKNVKLTLPVTVTINGAGYSGSKVVTYRSTGKSGAFR